MGMVYFGDIAEERRETIKTKPENCPIVGLEHITPGDIRLSNWDNGVENTFTKVFRKGDILFGRRRAYLKKAAVAPFDGICSGDITTIKAKEDKILPELLPFIVQNDAFFDFAVGKSAGSLSPRVKWEHLKTYQLNLPSMEEQKRLAKILMAAEETRQAYKKLIEQTDELIKAKFEEMFGAIHMSPEQQECMSNVEQLGTIILENKKSSIQVNQAKESNGTYPFFTSGLGVYKWDTSLVSGENIFLSTGGAATVQIYSGDAAYSTDTWCIKSNEKTLLTRILYYILYFNIDNINTFFFKGSGLKHLQKNDLKSVCIPILSMSQQQEFIVFAEQVEQTKLATQQSLDALNETVRALVNRNFN